MFDFHRVVGARLDRDRDGLLVFFVGVVLLCVAAAVYFLTDLLVAAAPVVHLASFITISCVTPYTSRRGVGQWGGAGGACCEDHFYRAARLLAFSARYGLWGASSGLQDASYYNSAKKLLATRDSERIDELGLHNAIAASALIDFTIASTARAALQHLLEQRCRALSTQRDGGARAPKTPPPARTANRLRPRHHRSHRRVDDRMGNTEAAKAHDEKLQSTEARDIQRVREAGALGAFARRASFTKRQARRLDSR